MSDEQFFKMIEEMTDGQIADLLERGGMFCAPNPHVVLEAAKRLRIKDAAASSDRRVKNLNAKVEQLKSAMLTMRSNLSAVVRNIGCYTKEDFCEV